MGKVVGGMTISLDGFIHDRNGSVALLYPDFDELRQSDMLQEAMHTTGAAVMGRRTYDMANGDFTGYEYQTPIFVFTHRAPDTPALGENDSLKFHFVDGEIQTVIDQAKAAARGKDVVIVGGADITQQCIRAGVLDELQIGIMPVLLGQGLRLFEQTALQPINLEKVRVIESPGGRTDIVFRVRS